jgi:hypothetical protein
MPSFYLLPLIFLPEAWALGLLLLSALALGMPHGAADLLAARRLGLPLLPYLALYLGLAGLLLALLLHQPALALLLFLGMALFHWGRVEGKGALGYLRAGTILLFPFLFHQEAIQPFLQAFSGGFGLPPWVAGASWGFLLLLALRERPRARALGDTLLLALVAALAPPLRRLGRLLSPPTQPGQPAPGGRSGSGVALGVRGDSRGDRPRPPPLPQAPGPPGRLHGGHLRPHPAPPPDHGALAWAASASRTIARARSLKMRRWMG